MVVSVTFHIILIREKELFSRSRAYIISDTRTRHLIFFRTRKRHERDTEGTRRRHGKDTCFLLKKNSKTDEQYTSIVVQLFSTAPPPLSLPHSRTTPPLAAPPSQTNARTRCCTAAAVGCSNRTQFNTRTRRIPKNQNF